MLDLFSVVLDLQELGRYYSDPSAMKMLGKTNSKHQGHIVSEEYKGIDYKEIAKHVSENIGEFLEKHSELEGIIDPKLVRKGYGHLKDIDIFYDD